MEIAKDTQNKRRLGRGLGSLLGGDDSPYPEAAAASATSQEAGSQENRVWNIAIDKLMPGKYQPRKTFEKSSMNELANSIKENGIIQPIAVRKRASGGFEILAGERRWRAAQLAGLHEVPAIIKTLTDREALQLALIENIQREDLDPIEEAESYQRLIIEFSLSQQEAAEKVGKERSSVANAIRLLGLAPEIREMLTKKEISVGHAKALLSVADKTKQLELAKKANKNALSVRALEAEIKNLHNSIDIIKTTLAISVPGGALNSPPTSSLVGSAGVDLEGKLAIELANQLQKTLGTKVQISYKKGSGSLQVLFYSDDQLTQIYEKLMR